MRSWHTDSNLSYFCASNCFVPGSSVFSTSTGCLYSGNAPSYSDATAPILLRTRGSLVSSALAIPSFVSFSVSLFTPELLYESFLSVIPATRNGIVSDTSHYALSDKRTDVSPHIKSDDLSTCVMPFRVFGSYQSLLFKIFLKTLLLEFGIFRSDILRHLFLERSNVLQNV